MDGGAGEPGTGPRGAAGPGATGDAEAQASFVRLRRRLCEQRCRRAVDRRDDQGRGRGVQTGGCDREGAEEGRACSGDGAPGHAVRHAHPSAFHPGQEVPGDHRLVGGHVEQGRQGAVGVLARVGVDDGEAHVGIHGGGIGQSLPAADEEAGDRRVGIAEDAE
eukprot:2141515-Rhodomonas_salina.1